MKKQKSGVKLQIASPWSRPLFSSLFRHGVLGIWLVLGFNDEKPASEAVFYGEAMSSFEIKSSFLMKLKSLGNANTTVPMQNS